MLRGTIAYKILSIPNDGLADVSLVKQYVLIFDRFNIYSTFGQKKMQFSILDQPSNNTVRLLSAKYTQ